MVSGYNSRDLNKSFFDMNNAFGNLLMHWIEVSGLSKKTVAEKAGMCRANLYKLLKGEISEIRFSTLVNLANALEVDPKEFISLYYSLYQDKVLSDEKVEDKNAFESSFVTDVNYPDYSMVSCGEEFEKVWAVKNTGNKSWENLRLVCQDKPLQVGEHEVGLQPHAELIEIPDTRPGEVAFVSVIFKAPEIPCSVVSKWKAAGSNGKLVFPEKTGLYCLVQVE